MAVVDNLFNRHYSDAVGYPALRLNYRLGMKYVGAAGVDDRCAVTDWAGLSIFQQLQIDDRESSKIWRQARKERPRERECYNSAIR